MVAISLDDPKASLVNNVDEESGVLSGVSELITAENHEAAGGELGMSKDLNKSTCTRPTVVSENGFHTCEQENIEIGSSKSNWTKEGIGHVKIRCKGRDSVPDDESVQKLCNEVLNFCSQRPNTKKFDFKIITIEFDGKRIKLQTWDTAGQERFRTITTAYYRGAMDILLVYDVTDKASFNNIRNWIRNIEQHASDNVNKILVGNKADMDESKRVVPTSKGQALADEYGIKFFETSAKTNMNVEEVFFPIARDIKQRLADTDSGSEPPAAFPNATIGLQCAP
ncbi:ras-related protein RABE1c [Lathyrus oleraceus]|uniref:ras-related protein RABE1c n=1 Tax=Pisum sativum TaxID=3888 RepID=UPI0021D0C24D|nr:ras-related protein RABE1c-like [Pisum sativum]